MGLRLIYFNTITAGLITLFMYEMLRHPMPGALKLLLYEETLCCIDDSRDKMLYFTTVAYVHTTFLMITELVGS